MTLWQICLKLSLVRVHWSKSTIDNSFLTDAISRLLLGIEIRMGSSITKNEKKW